MPRVFFIFALGDLASRIGQAFGWVTDTENIFLCLC